MLKDAFDSLNDIASPPFRKVVLKSLALTAAALLAAWFGLDRLALHFVDVQPPWLATLIAWMIGLSLLVGAVFLAAPVASLVASLFLDEIAAHVEAEVDPFGPAGPRRAVRRGDAGGAALLRLVACGRDRLADPAVHPRRRPGRLARRQRLSAGARVFRAGGDALPFRRAGARAAPPARRRSSSSTAR